MDTTKIYHFDMEIEFELKRSVNAIQKVVMETTKNHHLIWKLSWAQNICKFNTEEGGHEYHQKLPKNRELS